MSGDNGSEVTSPKTWAILVWGLYLASYVTFAITALVGLAIAYVKRRDLSGTPFESHMTSAIHTFWISLIVGLIGIVLSFVGVGIIILILLIIWNVFRIVRGLIRAVDGKPIASPESWF